MPDAFVVSTPAAAVTLAANRTAQVSFTVTNISGRPLRARLRVAAQEPTGAAWLTVTGPAERDFALGATESFVVTATVPPDVPAGTYAFRADAVGEQQPDEDFAQGPTVALSVPPAVIKGRPPWLIPLIIAILVLVVAVVVFVVISKSGNTKTTTSPASTTTPAASPTPSPTPTVTPQIGIGQLVNLPLTTAILDLNVSGLRHKVNYIGQSNLVSCDPPVIAVNPPAGSTVAPGSLVVLTAQRPFFFCVNLPN